MGTKTILKLFVTLECNYHIFVIGLVMGLILKHVNFPVRCGSVDFEHWPVNQRVTGSIPSRGTCLGCRPGPL